MPGVRVRIDITSVSAHMPIYAHIYHAIMWYKSPCIFTGLMQHTVASLKDHASMSRMPSACGTWRHPGEGTSLGVYYHVWC